MYINIYTRIYTYIYTYIHIYTHIYKHTYIYIHTYTHTHKHMYTYLSVVAYLDLGCLEEPGRVVLDFARDPQHCQHHIFWVVVHD